MKSAEFLTESLSRIAYHYTNLHGASKIMAARRDFQNRVSASAGEPATILRIDRV